VDINGHLQSRDDLLATSVVDCRQQSPMWQIDAELFITPAIEAEITSQLTSLSHLYHHYCTVQQSISDVPNTLTFNYSNAAFAKIWFGSLVEVRVRSGQRSLDDILSERSPAHTSTVVALGGSGV